MTLVMYYSRLKIKVMYYSRLKIKINKSLFLDVHHGQDRLVEMLAMKSLRAPAWSRPPHQELLQQRKRGRLKNIGLSPT